MDEQERLRHRIAEAVTRFHKEHMAITAELVSIDLHSQSLVVTLRDATCPAEKAFARDKKARELLEKCYIEVFGAVRTLLEAAVENALGRKVLRSMLSIDPESGEGVILFSLAAEDKSQDVTPRCCSEGDAD